MEADSLIALAGPLVPIDPPDAGDWAALAEEHGMEMDPDYRRLVEGLGTGEFGGGLELRNPNRRLVPGPLNTAQLDEERKSIRSGTAEPLELPLFPENGGYVIVSHIDRMSITTTRRSNCSTGSSRRC